MLHQLLPDHLGRLRAHDPIDDLPVLEDEEGRDAHHAVLLRGTRIFVDVELADDGATGKFLGQLLDRRARSCGRDRTRAPRSRPTPAETERWRPAKVASVKMIGLAGALLPRCTCSMARLAVGVGGMGRRRVGQTHRGAAGLRGATGPRRPGSAASRPRTVHRPRPCRSRPVRRREKRAGSAPGSRCSA